MVAPLQPFLAHAFVSRLWIVLDLEDRQVQSTVSNAYDDIVRQKRHEADKPVLMLQTMEAPTSC
jgi:hypothetical protein